MFNRKDLLGLKDMSADEIYSILDNAHEMAKLVASGNKKSPILSGKSVFMTFYENSTRTQSSFDHATKILSGNSINLSVGNSSVKKGEVLLDTAETLRAMGADAIVVRHSIAGSPHMLASVLPCAVVNAGDGLNEHPTQALLDMFTMQRHFGMNLQGLKVFICGDLKHSRVARSNIWGLATLGAEVTVCAPPTLMPQGFDRLGVRIVNRMEDGLKGAHVVMLLRLQLERQTSGIIPSVMEYCEGYEITEKRLKLADPHAIVMHPGPINRGAEIESAVADCAQSVIHEQVFGGLCVRMAALDLLINRRNA